MCNGFSHDEDRVRQGNGGITNNMDSMDELERLHAQHSASNEPHSTDLDDLLDPKTIKILEEILIRLNYCLNGTLIYPLTHPSVKESVTNLVTALRPFFQITDSLHLKFFNEEIIFQGESLLESSHLSKQLNKLFTDRGIWNFIINRDLNPEEVMSLIHCFRQGDKNNKPLLDDLKRLLSDRNVTHIRIAGEYKSQLMVPGSRYELSKSLYEQGSHLLESAALNAMDQKKFDIGQVRPIVQELIETLGEDPSALLAVSSLKSFDNYLFNHSMNVCILALCMGIYFKLDQSTMVDIGTGALLHDIGKIRIPIEILNKSGPLNEEEWRMIKQHPVEGVKMILHSRYATELPALIIYGHHRRIGGNKGYPVMSRDLKINPFVAIVSVCDTYDAMTTNRPYNSLYMPSGAIAEIKKLAGDYFDPEVVGFFEKVLGAYPIGTLVKLDTGEVGIVLRHNLENVYRPNVKIILNADGSMVDELLLYDLTERDGESETERFLHSIASVVDPLTVSFNIWECL